MRPSDLDDVLGAQAAVALRSVAQRDRSTGRRRRYSHQSSRSRRVRRRAVAAQRLEQIGDDVLHVTHDRHVGVAVLADLGRVDVGVNHLGVGGERVQLAGHPVVEAGAERDQQVALLQRADGRDGAVHARHAEVLRVAVGERAARHQRGDDRDAGQLGQLQQFGGRLAADHAAADVQHRLAGRRDQLGGLAHLPAVRLGVRLVAGQVDLRRPAERALRLQHVLGDVDQDGAGTSTSRDVERLGHHLRDLVAVADQEVVLGDRHGDAGDVGFLEGVGADQGAADLPGDRDDGDGVHLRVGQRGDEVGGAGTRGGHHHADLAGGVGVSAGGVPGALLVADQHVAELHRVEQRVVDRQHGAAGDAEDDVDVEFLERADDGLGARHLLRGNLSRLRCGRVCRLPACRWLGCPAPVVAWSVRSRCPLRPLGVVGLGAVLIMFSGNKKPPSADAARGLRVGS